MGRPMGLSAQIVEHGDGFDPAAAEAYLLDLRSHAASSPVAKITRHGPDGASVMKPVAPTPAGRASRRTAVRRTWTAVATAVAAPVAIGLGLGLWTTSRPTGPAPDTAPVSGTPQPTVNVYSVTIPVPADEPAADDTSTTVAAVDAGPGGAPSGAARYRRYGRGSIPASARSAAVSAPIEEAAPDFPSYGILDAAPSSGRAAETAPAN
jgi:hypothetical protein